jgi:hypothetical protein
MQRRLTLLSIILIALLLAYPIAIALASSEEIIVKQTIDTDSTVITPSQREQWQVFKVSQKCIIDIVQLELMQNGSITSLTIGFYDWNGSLGTKIYTQDIPASSIPTTYTITNYTLTTPVQLDAGTYALHFYLNGGSTGDFVALKLSTANPYADGDFWVGSIEQATWDLYFVLYGQYPVDPYAAVYNLIPSIVTIAMLGVALSMISKFTK